jgi:hypothetical protein
MKRVALKRVASKLAAVLIVAATFSSCAQVSRVSRVSDDAAYVFLLDKSASTVQRRRPHAGVVTGADARGEYLSALRHIVSALGPGTEVSGALIDGNSLSVTSLPVRAELPAFDQLLDNQLVYRDDVIGRKKELVRQLEVAVYEGERAQSTCIIDSLMLAQQIFEGARVRKKVLVMVGDMLEDCQGIDFDSNSRHGARGLPHDEGEVKLLLDELQKQHRIPNLGGVVVAVYGAKGGQQGDDNGRRYLMVKYFWSEFFKRAGAEVRDYGAFIRPPVASEAALDLSLPEENPAAGSSPLASAGGE